MPKFLSSFQNTLSVIASVARQSIKSPITNHQSLELRSKGQSSAYSKGESSAYVIIFVIVIIFAVMISGGASSLFSGNHPSSVIDTPIPTISTITPTVTPSTAAAWNLSFSDGKCVKETIPIFTGELKAIGSENGYISLEIQNGSTYTQIASSPFTKPETTFDMTLSNSDGFNTKKWQIVLFSGGTVTGNKWSGGTQHALYPGDSTGCT